MNTSTSSSHVSPTDELVREVQAVRPIISTVALVVANVVPLLGVVFWGWDVFTVMLGFWLENLVIGLFNVAKMIVIPARGGIELFEKIFNVPFFLVHYTGFCLIHGLFVIVLFGPHGDREMMRQFVSAFFHADVAGVCRGIIDYTHGALLSILAAMLISHGISFVHNFLGRGEYRQADVKSQMMAPYGRIVVLHITILLGAFLVQATGAHVLAIVLLVVLKTGIDLAAHWRERAKAAKASG